MGSQYQGERLPEVHVQKQHIHQELERESRGTLPDLMKKGTDKKHQGYGCILAPLQVQSTWHVKVVVAETVNWDVPPSPEFREGGSAPLWVSSSHHQHQQERWVLHKKLANAQGMLMMEEHETEDTNSLSTHTTLGEEKYKHTKYVQTQAS